MKRIVVFALVLNAALLGVIAHQLVAIAGGGAVATVNGDVNGDGWLNIADPVFMLNFLYSGGPAPVAFAGGPDHTAEIAELRGELSAHVEMLRSDVDAVTAGSASNAAAIATNSTDIAINSTDIAINATAVADLTANPAGGLSDEQSEMLGHMSIMQLAMDREGNTATTIRFSGVNVQVVNGTGSTDGTVNGLGNLVIGYQEFRPDDGVSINDRRGSHNLVVGKENNYSNWAAQVVGWHNTISGNFATVSGGYNNRAVEQYCTVGGGRDNLALGNCSTVSGGRENLALGGSSTVGGGQENTASSSQATVSGGGLNTAQGSYSTVSGGSQNTASGRSSTVSGGQWNTAAGDWRAVGGGRSEGD